MGRVGRSLATNFCDLMDSKQSAIEHFNSLYKKMVNSHFVTMEIDFCDVRKYQLKILVFFV